MRLKDLFTVPPGQSVTEKHLRRVLISSICSILLCMSCLVGTTRAWFTVSIEDTENVIWIGEPNVTMAVDAATVQDEAALSAGIHSVTVNHGNPADPLGKKSTLYVTLTFRYTGGNTAVYTALTADNGYTSTIEVRNETGAACTMVWEATWFPPFGIDPAGGVITLTPASLTDTATPPTTVVTTPAQTETTVPATTEATVPEITEATVPKTTEATEAATVSTEPDHT